MSVKRSPLLEPRQLRQFAATLLAVTVAAVGLRVVRHQPATWPVLAAVLVAGATGIAGLVRPSFVDRPYRVLAMATKPIGWVVSEALLLVLYFGVITPIAFLGRLTGRDRLQRAIDLRAHSYWVPRQDAGEQARYFRQS